ncbi:MAG: assimilatory sulfite reductase (NADPH) flavoprotein subunit [Sphingomonadaceae bacterium]
MKIADYPGVALTLEQWGLVTQLSKSLSPAQARWISGYFAGFDAGLTQVAVPLSANAAVAPKLTILYGTETGNAADLAKVLAEAARAKGLAPTLADMAAYKHRELALEEDILILVSTYGEGDPPQPAAGFFEFVEGRKAPTLEGKRFAVLALGDSTYEYYCEAGKKLDHRFEELGARRLAPRADCDVDYEEPAAAWTAQILDLLAADAVAPVPAAATDPLAVTASAHDKRNPFAATVIDNLPIIGRGSSKETRHVELSLAGSGLRYEPGDALGIAVSNDPIVVDRLLDVAGFAGDTVIELKGKAVTLAEAFTHDLEITAATPRFLDYWTQISEADALRNLHSEDRTGERAVFLRTHHVADIVRRFPLGGVRPEGFARALRPLQPRLYSIASSLAVTVDEAHLTVAPVRYTLHGEARTGVASGMLADRIGLDASLPVYIQSNAHFRLPVDDAPIIMIGAGTGVAPFRAFLQEREARGVNGRSWLFFGERNFRTDFLYQTEWQGWLRDGTLSRMDVAFSRDRADKIYVQHRMAERAGEIFAWLEDGAHIYLCGDAAHLAPDVHETLIEIVESQSRTGRESAEDYVRSLQADHRYQRDVY